MRVLVTGAAGRIGMAVCDRLRRRGDVDVVAASRTGSTGDSSLPLDLLDHAAVQSTLQRVRPSVVVHLAGMVGPVCNERPAEASALNVDAVGVLARSALAAGVTRVLLASTGAVYGDRGSAPATEDDPLLGATHYAQTKIRAEKILDEVSVASNGALAVVSLRIFNVWGEAFPDSLPERIRRANASEPVSLWGLDSFVRDYIHVSDVSAAVERAVCTPLGRRSLSVNVGRGIPVSNRDLIDRLPHTPESVIVHAGEWSYNCADTRKAETELGFRAQKALFVGSDECR